MRAEKSVSLPGEIEIRMIGQVDHCVFVGRSPVLNLQIPLDQCIAHGGRQVPWKSRLAVLAQVSQFDAVGDRFGLPYDVVKTMRPAMQSVLSIVSGQRIFLAMQSKTAMCDSIGIAPDDCSEK